MHELLDDPEQLDHGLLLTIAEGVVFEKEQTHGEAVLEVLDVEQMVDRPHEHVGEGGTLRGEQLGAGRLGSAVDQRRQAFAGQKVEALGDGRGVGELGPLGQRPAGHVEVLGHPLVADQEHLPVELEEDRGQSGPVGHQLDQVGQQRVALEEGRGLPGQQLGQGLSDQRQTAVVGDTVGPVQSRRAPHQQPAQRE